MSRKTGDADMLAVGLGPIREGAAYIKKTFRGLPEVRSGGSIKKVFGGERLGRAVVAFEHTFMISTGSVTMPIQRSVYAISTAPWPRVDVTPRSGFGYALARLLGRRGLELDVPEFNRRFAVRAEDENFALLLLTPDVQRHALSKPGVTWRTRGGWLFLVYSGALKTKRAGASVERLCGFLERTPPELEHWATEAA